MGSGDGTPPESMATLYDEQYFPILNRGSYRCRKSQTADGSHSPARLLELSATAQFAENRWRLSLKSRQCRALAGYGRTEAWLIASCPDPWKLRRLYVAQQVLTVRAPRSVFP